MKKQPAFALLGLLLATLPLQAQTPPQPIAYDAIEFGKLPADIYMGEGVGVAVNSKGHVFIFTRSGGHGPAYNEEAAQLLEFDADGKFIREIGKNLYAWSFAHSVRIDKDDNIWATDKGSDMVVEFNPAGRVKMVFGRKQEASDEGTGPLKHPKPPLPPVPGYFRQVTDVAWDSKGDTYVSDGYINSRVAIYDKDGNYVSSFGEPGTGPGQFNTPHGVVVDANDNVYVADRGNGRIQVFDTSGKLQRIITINVPAPSGLQLVQGGVPNPNAVDRIYAPGAPDAICITPPVASKPQYIFSADSYPGRVYKLALDGTVLGYLGQVGKKVGEFGAPHALACPNEHTVFVAELRTWRVQKLTLR